MYVCIHTHTHTHTAHMEYSDVSPGVGMRHLEGPGNPDRPNLGINIFVYVCKVHTNEDCFLLLLVKEIM